MGMERKEVTGMRRLPKRWCAWMCVIALCLPWAGASAEFSPLWSAMTRGDGIRAEASGSLDALAPLTARSLNAVNAWLARLGLRLNVRESEESAALTLDGDSLFSVRIGRTQDGVLAAFSPSGGAYLTDADGKDALQLLAGGNDWIFPSPTLLPALYASLSASLYPLLAEAVTPKTVQDSTSVKNALSSPAYVNYVFQGEVLNERWPRILEILLPLLRETLKDRPDWFIAAERYLTTMEFSGECRFKRMLDKSGGDMGLQFTGQIAAEGLDKRKATLFGGFTPGRGGYVSLSLPAVKGKNTLKISFGAKLTAKDAVNTLTIDGAFSRALNGVSLSADLEGTLRNTMKNGIEQWSGQVTVSTSADGRKAVWTITPALTGADNALSGTVTAQQKIGSAVKLKGTVQARLSPAEATPAWSADGAADLRGMDEAAARAAVLGEMAPLTRAFLRLMLALPENERTLLTHDLRTDEWMNGPPAPAADPEPDEEPWDTWIVVEEE